ncbi:MAG: hypothetical protein P1P59_04695 [Treponemataceae bacterium]
MTSKFDSELLDFAHGKITGNHIFNLGLPDTILQKCGFPAQHRIELSSSRLVLKAAQGNHPFNIVDIIGLDKAMQKPIAVFEYGNKEKAENVIVNLSRDNKNFLVGVFFNQERDGLEVSSIRGLFNRDNIDWLRWIDQGKMIYGNKKEIQVLIAQQRTNLADVNNKEAGSASDSYYLDSVDSILKTFKNVNDIYTKDFPHYAEYKERYKIFQRFRECYQKTESLDVYLAKPQSDKFYAALKTNDYKTLETFLDNFEYREIQSAVKDVLVEYFHIDEAKKDASKTVNKKSKTHNDDGWER